jgi:hypothetical protein
LPCSTSVIAWALHAEAFLEGDLAVAADQEVGAGDLARVHVGLEARPDGLQFRRIEAQPRGVAPHDRRDLRVDHAPGRGRRRPGQTQGEGRCEDRRRRPPVHRSNVHDRRPFGLAYGWSA